MKKQGISGRPVQNKMSSLSSKNAPQKRSFFQYSEEDLDKALDASRNGLSSLRRASLQYNVPYSTLYQKYNGKNPIEQKMDPCPYLTKEEEGRLVQWILDVGKKGFPVTKEQLLDSVQMIIKKLNRKTPFKDGKLGRHWYESFLRRYPLSIECYIAFLKRFQHNNLATF